MTTVRVIDGELEDGRTCWVRDGLGLTRLDDARVVRDLSGDMRVVGAGRAWGPWACWLDEGRAREQLCKDLAAEFAQLMEQARRTSEALQALRGGVVIVGGMIVAAKSGVEE